MKKNCSVRKYIFGRHVLIITAMCIFIMQSITVYADVIAPSDLPNLARPNIAKSDITETDNDFFNQYRNDCVYLGRSFCANGDIAVKSAPSADDEIAVIENADIAYIDYSCLYNGDYWGFTSFYTKEYPTSIWYGWVKIDDRFSVLYDYVAFGEEHFEEFYTYSGGYEQIRATRAALAWGWPGADAPLWTIEDIDTESFSVLYAYKDEQGREWGFSAYLYDSPNVWFCLSDPLNRDIPAFNSEPAPARWVSDTEHKDIAEAEKAKKSEDSAVMLIIILVAALAVGTIVLIKLLPKPNKVKEESK